MKKQKITHSGDLSKTNRIVLITIGILGALVLLSQCGCNFNSRMDDRNYNFNDSLLNEDSTILGNKDTCFICTKESFKTLLIEKGILYPDWVLKQALIESGHFTSNVFKKTNNCFGFHNGKSYLEFNSIESCVEYYASWQKKYYKSGDYLVFLSDYGYAKDTNYINLLKMM